MKHIAALLPLVVVPLLAQRAEAADLLICAADEAISVADVVSKIQGTGIFTTVDTHDCGSSNPTPAMLGSYDAVFTWEGIGRCYSDPWTLGDMLADYADGGGGVVVGTSEGCTRMQGRLRDDGYLPYSDGMWDNGWSFDTLNGLQPAHPILAGVSSFDGGPESYRERFMSVSPTADLVAEWGLSGDWLVATNNNNGTRVAGLNFYPPSQDAGWLEFWDPASDGDLIMANAAKWAANILDPTDSVLLCSTGDTAWRADVQTKLNDTGRFSVVDVMDCGAATPTPGQLSGYDAVYVWEYGGCFWDSWSLGNNLADYADAGGGVVVGVADCGGISGRFYDEQYMPYQDGLFTDGSSGESYAEAIPGHAIFDGVSSFDGGGQSWHNASSTLTPGHELVASWDGNGEVFRQRVVGLNMHPVSEDLGGPDYWDSTTDGATIMANALLWTTTPSSQEISVLLCSTGDTAWRADVQDKLMDTGRFSVVDVMDCSSVTPMTGQLAGYDAVYVWEYGSCFWDSWSLGDNLADYADAGGGVVVGVMDCGGISGRLYDEFYMPYQDGFFNNGTPGESYTEVIPGHAIFDGVISFDGGNLSLRNASSDLNPGLELVATWENTGEVFAAKMIIGLAHVVGLNIHPVSSDLAGAGFWRSATYGATLMANALFWSSLACADMDGDTFSDEACGGDDCDDADTSINPGASEILCDSIDQNCNGAADDDVDVDGDGFSVCTGDCDDTDVMTNPGSAEILCDTIDQNCNGLADDDADADADGFSFCTTDCDDADVTINPDATEILCDSIDQNCSGPADDDVDADADGFSFCTTDCDDADVTINPDAVEILCDTIDQNCNGLDDDDVDVDDDGFSYCTTDCDDDDALINPDAVEILCDTIDQNCNGLDDDDVDVDADGFSYCTTDCDDDDALINPDAVELLCDTIDQNCNGLADDDVDADDDGFGFCTTDCDDDDALINPDAVEILCDTIDQNCSGLADDDVDVDDDGHSFCTTDCDDDDALISPDASEVLCDTIDQNCNGLDDDDVDADDDGFSFCTTDCDDDDADINPDATEVLCDTIDQNCNGLDDDDVDVDDDGHSLCTTDCDDDDADINPDVTEILCDTIDQNCNGLDDDDVDADDDGFSFCTTDCDDDDADINPGATEILCDTIDQNCNGMDDDDIGEACIEDAPVEDDGCGCSMTSSDGGGAAVVLVFALLALTLGWRRQGR